MSFEFSAKKIVCYVEDDVCVVAFADSMSAAPDSYLIVSKLLLLIEDEDNVPSVEYSSNGEGDCVNVNVDAAQLDAKTFRMEVNLDQSCVRQFLITLECPLPPDLPEHLAKIFNKSKTPFTIETP